ncbi:hypothetical protein AB5N19_13932 [Seiridium cardinale]
MAATPNPTVTRSEDQLVRALSGTELGALRADDGFPYRPGHGTRGSPVTLLANYFEVRVPQQLVLYKYAIRITRTGHPRGSNTEVAGRKREQIVRLLLEQHLAAQRVRIYTDFRKTLISHKRSENDSLRFEVVYRDEQEEVEAGTSGSSSRTYRVDLQYTGSSAVADLIAYMASTNPSDVAFGYDSRPIVQAFNIFLNDYARRNHKRLVQVGGSKTFSLGSDAESCDLTGGLKVIRGFFSSIRVAQGRLLVNVNVHHGVFYHDGMLDKLIDVYHSQNRRLSKPEALRKLQLFLKRLRVTTSHIVVNSRTITRTKTISGLAGTEDGRVNRNGTMHPPKVPGFGAGANSVEFWLDEGPGRYITITEFFQTKYGIRLNKPNMPVVNVGTREHPTYLPAELCKVLPGQPARQPLNPQQTENMIKEAVRRPATNQASIMNAGLNTVGLTPNNPAMVEYGLQVNPNMLAVSSRVLPQPTVLYASDNANIRDSAWNMQGKKFRNPRKLTQWSWVILSTPYHVVAEDIAYFGPVFNRFYKAMAATGMAVSMYKPPRIIRLDAEDDVALDEVFSKAAGQLDLLFVVLSSDNSPAYNRIKKCGDQRHGIATVCMVGKKMATKGDQYYKNVAPKVNLKLRGTNQAVRPASLPLISEGKTMIVGLDVTHPSTASRATAPSVAAMVANIDACLGQWPATLSIQDTARQEMVTDLKAMLKSRLDLWRSNNTARPENILVYRDGVSEGQFQLVVEQELPHLREACREYYPTEETAKGLPRFTIIIVGKRHHTRFYPMRPEDGDKNGNPKPGTVVDRGVTEARAWDFFLQPHIAIQGTARPAHYFVVLDEIFRAEVRRRGGLPPGYNNVADMVEELTHGLCYVFGRATRGVSICTPAYYADIACERARCYLSDFYDSTPTASAAGSTAGQNMRTPRSDDVRVHDRLKNTMFYI